MRFKKAEYQIYKSDNEYEPVNGLVSKNFGYRKVRPEKIVVTHLKSGYKAWRDFEKVKQARMFIELIEDIFGIDTIDLDNAKNFAGAFMREYTKVIKATQ